MYKQLLLCTSLALAGCNSTPSNGDIEDFLSTKFSSCKNIKVVDVKKTNGYEKDGYYQVEFSYVIKYDAAKDLHRAYLEDKESNDQGVAYSKIYHQKKAELEDEILKLELEFSKSTPSPNWNPGVIVGSTADKEQTAASEEWQRKRAEFTKQKRDELKALEDAASERNRNNRSNGVLTNEGNRIYAFNLAGCAQDAYRFAPVSFPEKDEDAERTGDKSYMFKAHESPMKGTLAMRKTENGWRALSQN